MFIIIVFWLWCDWPSGLLFFVPSLLLSMLMLSSLLTFFVCFFVLFHSCCSHARVFWKHSCLSSPCPIAILNVTFLFSRGEIVCLGRSLTYQNQTKLNCSLSQNLWSHYVCVIEVLNAHQSVIERVSEWFLFRFKFEINLKFPSRA